MKERIDVSRLPDAHRVLDFTLARVLDDGRYHPISGLFAETTGYQAELAGTLAVAGRLLDRPEAIDASQRIFERLLHPLTRVDGLWGLDWWWDFPFELPPPADWRAQNTVVDPRYSAAMLWSLGQYHRASGDESVVEPAEIAMTRLFSRYDFLAENHAHMTAEFAAIATVMWSHVLPAFMAKGKPIIDWVIKSAVEMARRDFPFFTAVRTALLLAATGTEHLETIIIPAFEAFLAEPRWRFDFDRQHFRHIADTDATHVNIRANMAVGLTMRLIDVALDEPRYTETNLYEQLAAWSDGQKASNGGYYETWDPETGRRFGQGSPSNYIPLWWILGGLVIEPVKA